jgi:HAD superfamily hydrolase (TIGR01450 family)
MIDIRPDVTDDAALPAVRAEGWVIDVDGCLVRTRTPGGSGGVALPGAAEFLAWLRRHGRPFVVCTNASQRPVHDYALHLRDMGLDVADDEMMTAATAGGRYIAARHPGRSVLPVGDRGLDEALRHHGIELATPGGPPAGVVLVGAADNYATATLNAACLAIADHGASFYVTVDEPWFHGGVGRSMAASTAIAAAIGSITGRRPELCGKPSRAIGEVLRERLGGFGRRLAVIGDMASIENRLAHRMDALGVLVMSGGTSAAEIPELPPAHRPHLAVADIGALLQLMQAIEP